MATPAQAFVLAGLVRLGSRRPVLVVTPTGAAAEQLAHDLEVFTGEPADGRSGDRGRGFPEGTGRVEVFPAWETLPFERVSPDVATMGRRLRLLWRLGGAGAATGDPAGDGPATERAATLDLTSSSRPSRPSSNGSAPGGRRPAPFVCPSASRWWPTSSSARWSPLGYRREPMVEHRGELAVRGGIIDVFPSTADAPVRIDLWGDEVDRLTRFDVGDQRSVEDLAAVEMFGCRELVLDEVMRKRAADLVGAEPWGRQQWDRLADAQSFDGMESWLPWLVDGEELLCDLLGEDALIVLVEPRRIRDRAGELLEEETALAEALASTWGGGHRRTSPRLHLPFERMLAATGAGVVSLLPSGDATDAPSVESRGWEPILGDAGKLAAQIGGLVEAGYTVLLCAQSAAPPRGSRASWPRRG